MTQPAAAPSGLHCRRCDHVWVRRADDLPRQCPRCHSPYWDRARSVGTCEQCNAENVHVARHRKISGRNGGTYVPENITMLCASCHSRADIAGRTGVKADRIPGGGKAVSVRLTQEDVMELARIAEAEKCSMNHIIRRAIRRALYHGPATCHRCGESNSAVSRR